MDVRRLVQRVLFARLVTVVSVLILLVGCSSGGGTDRDGGAGDALDRTTTSSTTTTIAPSPPELRVPARARAEIGQVFSDAIVAVDPNGDDTTIEISARTPVGFTTSTNGRGRITGFQWQPVEAGEWTIEVTATDTTGRSATESLTLISRHSRDRDLLVVLGDSVAAGFGRDRTDFAGSDDCFRSERDSYGVLVADALIDAGSLAADADVLVVACVGATTRSLRTVPVSATDGDGNRVDDADGSQLDIVVAANPTVVTMTIGASELPLFNVDALVDSTVDLSSGEPVFNELFVERALDAFDRDLQRALETLVRSTDAHVVITTWYDPTASDPVGVNGCSGSCFRDAMSDFVSQVNAVISEAAADQPSGRVSVARLDGEADIWEAGNGFGPDVLRDRLGPLQGLADSFTGGSSATCAANGGPAVELISALDCAHPNSEGHRAIAAIVTEVLLSI